MVVKCSNRVEHFLPVTLTDPGGTADTLETVPADTPANLASSF